MKKRHSERPGVGCRRHAGPVEDQHRGRTADQDRSSTRVLAALPGGDADRAHGGGAGAHQRVLGGGRRSAHAGGVFPGYGTTILQVTVDDQTSVKGCPSSGTYQNGIPANLGTTFSQTCRDRLITPRWSPNRSLPFAKRFSLPPGVEITIPDYGKTSSAPVYDPLYSGLEAAGYTADRNLVVAGYNFLLTPDLGGFLARTKRLIVQTWRRNGRHPVRLVGHSNGPLYAQYLLTHVSAAWKHKYIQGFTDIAATFPGQDSCGGGCSPAPTFRRCSPTRRPSRRHEAARASGRSRRRPG